MGLVSLMFSIFIFIPSLAIGVRRLHDTGKSWLPMLWALLPLIGWIILIVMWVRPSEGHNIYGAPGDTSGASAAQPGYGQQPYGQQPYGHQSQQPYGTTAAIRSTTVSAGTAPRLSATATALATATNRGSARYTPDRRRPTIRIARHPSA